MYLPNTKFLKQSSYRVSALLPPAQKTPSPTGNSGVVQGDAHISSFLGN